MASGYTLTGVDPNDPIPGIIREILFAQGQGSGANTNRLVLLYGNKTSDGTEATNTIGDPIQSRDDVITRFGRRSEIRWLFESYVQVDSDAMMYAIAVPENGSGATASVDFTFTTTATARGNILIENMGRSATVPVEIGDTVTTQAAACKAAINAWEESGMPFTADNSSGVLTVTTSQKGLRAGRVLDQLRIRYLSSTGSSVAKGSITEGTGADDFTTAYAAAAAWGDFYYQVNPSYTTSSTSATDNGVGEGAAYIATQALPVNGKGQQMIFGLTGTNAQAVTVATSVNSVRCKFVWAEDNPFWPGMLAAQFAAVMRSQEIAHPGAKLAGYTSTDSTPFYIPAPYSADSRPTTTEVRAALNNGITPITFDKFNRPIVVRHVTSRSLNASGATDYRARPGHIPSCMDYAWAELLTRVSNQMANMPFVGPDPQRGQKPLGGVMTPSIVGGIVGKVTTDLSGPWAGGSPVLDPSALNDTLATIGVIPLNNGYSVKWNPISVRHMEKWQGRIEESSPAY
jgi:phage tail sheath gpL-like